MQKYNVSISPMARNLRWVKIRRLPQRSRNVRDIIAINTIEEHRNHMSCRIGNHCRKMALPTEIHGEISACKDGLCRVRMGLNEEKNAINNSLFDLLWSEKIYEFVSVTSSEAGEAMSLSMDIANRLNSASKSWGVVHQTNLSWNLLEHLGRNCCCWSDN